MYFLAALTRYLEHKPSGVCLHVDLVGLPYPNKENVHVNVTYISRTDPKTKITQ